MSNLTEIKELEFSWIPSDQEIIIGYQWIYPGKHDHWDFQKIKSTQTNYYDKDNPDPFALLDETPIFRRDDIAPGMYKEITKYGYRIVTYVSKPNDKFVYKDGFEYSYEKNKLKEVRLYNSGQIVVVIHLDEFPVYKGEQLVRQVPFINYIILYQDGIRISDDSFVNIDFNKSKEALYSHFNYDPGTEKLEGYQYEYTVAEPDKYLNFKTDDNGQLIFPLPRDQIVSYYNVENEKLSGPFYFGWSEGTFNGKIEAYGAEFTVRNKDPLLYAEGYLRINDKEYYVTESDVIPYDVWLNLVGEDVSQNFEDVPETTKLITDFIREPKIDKYNLPTQGYQDIVKRNIEVALNKQDPVTKTILEYLKK